MCPWCRTHGNRRHSGHYARRRSTFSKPSCRPRVALSPPARASSLRTTWHAHHSTTGAGARAGRRATTTVAIHKHGGGYGLQNFCPPRHTTQQPDLQRDTQLATLYETPTHLPYVSFFFFPPRCPTVVGGLASSALHVTGAATFGVHTTVPQILYGRPVTTVAQAVWASTRAGRVTRTHPTPLSNKRTTSTQQNRWGPGLPVSEFNSNML